MSFVTKAWSINFNRLPAERYQVCSLVESMLGVLHRGNFMSTNLSQLPKDLPVPVDDDAASHLEGSFLPSLVLQSTDGTSVDVAGLAGNWVIYIYPMTGRPDVPLPDGWDGTLPQSSRGHRGGAGPHRARAGGPELFERVRSHRHSLSFACGIRVEGV